MPGAGSESKLRPPEPNGVLSFEDWGSNYVSAKGHLGKPESEPPEGKAWRPLAVPAQRLHCLSVYYLSRRGVQERGMAVGPAHRWVPWALSIARHGADLVCVRSLGGRMNGKASEPQQDASVITVVNVPVCAHSLSELSPEGREMRGV